MVINLGTNDATAASFSAAPKKIEEQYEKDYVHFLKTVRKCNGDKTKIICALGSMDYYFYDAMNRAVDTYRAETGDNNVCNSGFPLPFFPLVDRRSRFL